MLILSLVGSKHLKTGTRWTDVAHASIEFSGIIIILLAKSKNPTPQPC
jgi:hypothetical protein